MGIVAHDPVDQAELAKMTNVTEQGVAVSDCVPAADGTDAGTQLNALLASLRAAGIIAT